jgi:hypothetical protein
MIQMIKSVGYLTHFVSFLKKSTKNVSVFSPCGMYYSKIGFFQIILKLNSAFFCRSCCKSILSWTVSGPQKNIISIFDLQKLILSFFTANKQLELLSVWELGYLCSFHTGVRPPCCSNLTAFRLPMTKTNIAIKLNHLAFYPRWHAMPRGSCFCFVVFVESLIKIRLYSPILFNFSFHHALLQPMFSSILQALKTDRRPAYLQSF